MAKGTTHVPGVRHAHMVRGDLPAESESFTCPFERLGHKKGLILEITLSEMQDERFAELTSGYENFYSNPEIPGMCLVLPRSMQGIFSSLEELKHGIVQYQADMLAAEFEFRLRRFKEMDNGGICFRRLGSLSKHRALCYVALLKKGRDILPGFQWNMKSLSDLMLRLLHENPEADSGGEMFRVRMLGHDSLELMRISFGGITLNADREQLEGPENNNTFSIVKCPLYPPQFGRYSERIEIWVTRQRDFLALSNQRRKEIRQSSCKVLSGHGVVLERDDATQHGGVWIPEYE